MKRCEGSEGVLIWDLTVQGKSPKSIGIPGGSASGLRGSTTALVWTTRDNDEVESLVYGTQAGYLVVWVQRGRVCLCFHLFFSSTDYTTT